MIFVKKQSVFFLTLLAALCIVGCSGEKKEIVAAVTDRTKVPMMHADSVTTLVSDSGITRYRIRAVVWEIYDRVPEPYWDFPKGIRFERFDLALRVDANIRSDFARFYQNRRLWELRGGVHAVNMEGTEFVTELMFWDQNAEKIYTDSLTVITQADGRMLTARNGFEANQQMTRYTFKNNFGKIPVNEE